MKTESTPSSELTDRAAEQAQVELLADSLAAMNRARATAQAGGAQSALLCALAW
jgi:hypothetical protein